MSIEQDKIQARFEKVEKDVTNVTEQIKDLDKKRIEAVALLNAIQGAKQQCQMFLQEFNNEANAGDLGELPPVDPFEAEK